MTTIAVEAPETFVFQPQTLVRNWGMAVRDTLQKVKAGIGTKPETLSDEELMAAICGGSEFALELLYERYHRYAFSLAYRILQDPASAEPELWEQAWHDEQSRLIRAALDQIPPEQRQVIELAYFGGYTHAEISEQWNIPLGTVKGRMRLGMQKLKLLLQEDGIDML